MRRFASFCICLGMASASFAQEQVSTTVEIHGAGFNVKSNGSVTYFKTLT